LFAKDYKISKLWFAEWEARAGMRDLLRILERLVA
jgi:hypothetical protein